MLAALALLAAAFALAPILGVIAAALRPETTAAIASSDLVRYGATSMVLAAGVGLTTAVVGVGAAWLVARHRFPGRDLFAWALALPLATPAFALAYAYVQIFDVAGDLRIWMRGAWGHDLPIQMRSIPGAIFVLSCAFYPYVYLAMRAAFTSQTAQPLEAARMLGASSWRLFGQVVLPLARPALAAGLALVIMETLADYGAVQFLSVQTLTTGVVRAWSVYGSPASAARFALPLLGAAALFLWLERQRRGERRFDASNAGYRPLAPLPLTGWRGALATLFCLTLLTLALLAPLGWLLARSLAVTPDWARLGAATGRTLAMGGVGAVVTVGVASVLALGAPRMPILARAASLGYATPGAVMAIGLLAPAAIFWGLLPAAASSAVFGVTMLVYAYAARLMAAALEPIEAGLKRVGPRVGDAARNLGKSEIGAAISVQIPIARGALLTALLVVFIDVLKELPATLILRPFDFDTLAVLASNYALDERLPQAGWPALLIVALALPGVIWLTRKITAARPGADL